MNIESTVHLTTENLEHKFGIEQTFSKSKIIFCLNRKTKNKKKIECYFSLHFFFYKETY